jgi:hypothetical protein
MRGLPVRPLSRGPSPRGLVRKQRSHPEDDIQRAVVQHLALRLVPGAVFWATPNGGARNKVTGAILKATGTKAGIPDLFLFSTMLGCMRSNSSPKAAAFHLRNVNARQSSSQPGLSSPLRSASTRPSISCSNGA